MVMNDKLRRSAMLRVALNFLFLAPIVFPAQLPAQSRKPMMVAEIATYMGPDREQLLYAEAKAEGVVTWYTSLAGDSYKALARSFETNYPGLDGQLGLLQVRVVWRMGRAATDQNPYRAGWARMKSTVCAQIEAESPACVSKAIMASRSRSRAARSN